MHTTINHINCKTHLRRTLDSLESGPHLSPEVAVPAALCRCRLLMSRSPSSRHDKGFMRVARWDCHGATELVTSLSAAAPTMTATHCRAGPAARRRQSRPGLPAGQPEEQAWSSGWPVEGPTWTRMISRRTGLDRPGPTWTDLDLDDQSNHRLGPTWTDLDRPGPLADQSKDRWLDRPGPG